MKIMIDTNIHDCIDRDSKLHEEIKQLINNGKIQILTTHIQEDELNRIKDESIRARLSNFVIKKVPTSVMVWGVSKWGEAKYGSGKDQGFIYYKIKLDNPKHIEDAIISATAAEEADVLVTEDKKLRNKIQNNSLNLKVWSFNEFKLQISDLSS